MAFIFPGQGSQKVGMGHEFYQKFSSFREVFAEVSEAIGKDIANLVFHSTAQELSITENTQICIMAVSIGIIRVIESELKLKVNGFTRYAAGHSVGEYSALCAGGFLSLTDTARLLLVRSKAMHQASLQQPGGMVAVLGSDSITVEELTKLSSEESSEVCVIANDNGAGQFVVSGTAKALSTLKKIARDLGVKKVIDLPVSGAFHSPLVSNARKELGQAIDSTPFSSSSCKVIHNHSANIATSLADMQSLLTQQIDGRVRWRETMQYLEQQEVEWVVEVGPGKVLSNLLRRDNHKFKVINIDSIIELEQFLPFIETELNDYTLNSQRKLQGIH